MPQNYRLSKVMAMMGLGSRRQCEGWIQQGKVTLDGHVCQTLPAFIKEGQSFIWEERTYKVSSQVPQVRVWRFHKPPGVLITRAPDGEGRSILTDLLPPQHRTLISVGRLDYASRGLLLLTNSGMFARTMELPSSSIPRRYCVDLKKNDGLASLEGDIADIQRGKEVDDVRYGPIPVISHEIKNPHCVRLIMVLYEGKNREIRRIMGSLGYHILRLERIAYGPWQLGNLNLGAIEEVPIAEVKSFYKARLIHPNNTPK